MKHSILYGVIISVGILTLFAFKGFQDGAKDIGAIGDVKYSILPPLKFRAENGDGWILMDGGNSLETAARFDTSALHKNLQIPTLPDARGVFIRGINGNRDKSTGDEDSNRNAGDPQQDMVGPHSHEVPPIGWVGDIFHYSLQGPGNVFLAPNPNSSRTKLNDGTETRPRNIALYIYIKVN